MPGKRLNITVVSSNSEDKNVYLSERPELTKFFNIDGCLQVDPSSYGDIQFVEHTLSVDNSEQDMDFLSGLYDDGNPGFDYAFVATGRDSRNLAIARTISTICLTSASQAFLGKEGILLKRKYKVYFQYMFVNIMEQEYFILK